MVDRVLAAPLQRAAVGAPAGWLRMLPARLVVAYLAVTLLLFVSWPINWPIYGANAWLELFGYLSLCFTILYAAFSGGSGGGVRTASSLAYKRFIIIGAALAIVLLTPSAYYYSGRFPWQVLEALADQGEAYRGLQDTLADTQGQRGPISAARAISAAFIFAVVPLGILNWGRLDWRLRGAVIATAICALIFSILRGTDREFADTFIVAGSALLVTLGRQGGARGRLQLIISRYWRPAIAVALFLAIAATLFADRKEARLGGTSSVCAVGTGICVDLADPRISWMGDRTLFSVSIFTMAISQGYYGLSIGMQQPFRSTYGIGHSPAATALYQTLTRDTELPSRAYTLRNSLAGWDPEYFWSTMLLWFANDVGFLGVLPLLGVIGFVWGRAWRDATLGHNDAAGVLFCSLMIMMVYLPANNQLFIAFDGYFILAAWSYFWLRTRGRVKAR